MIALVIILMGENNLYNTLYNQSVIHFLNNVLYYRMIAVMSPEDSWVCKWQRISKLYI